MERVCVTCGKVFEATSWNKIYCTEPCRNIGIFGPIEKPCPICGQLIHTKRSACSRSCLGKIPKDQTIRKDPEFRKKLSAALKRGYQCDSGEARRARASERMSKNNPAMDADVIKRITDTRRKNGTLHMLKLHRGGNGHLTEPQIRVAAMFPECVLELAIPTKLGGTGVAPNAYKVDIGFPKIKLAVEIDGHSHNSPSARARDEKKDSILTGLGWYVLRIKNEDAMLTPETVRSKIQSMIDSLNHPGITWINQERETDVRFTRKNPPC